MEQKDVLATVRAYGEAWAAGDAAACIGFYADDVVFHYLGDNPFAGDHAGKAAAVAAVGRLSQAVKRERPIIHDVLAGGEGHAAIMANEVWHVGGARVELHRVLVFHVRAGKLAECWIYDEDQRRVDDLLTRALKGADAAS